MSRDPARDMSCQILRGSLHRVHKQQTKLTWGEGRRVGRVVDDTLWVRMIVARHLRDAGARSRCLDLTDRLGRSSSSLNVRETGAWLGPGGHPRADPSLRRVRGLGGQSRI